MPMDCARCILLQIKDRIRERVKKWDTEADEYQKTKANKIL